MKKFLRKRLLTYVLTVCVIPVMQQLGMPAELMDNVIQLAMAYIGGQSLSDAAAAWGSKSKTEGATEG